MASHTKIPAVEASRTDVESMRVRHRSRAEARLAELRGLKHAGAAREDQERALVDLAARTGLELAEVRELLKAGRTPADLLSLSETNRR
jgi:hypothetical protein